MDQPHQNDQVETGSWKETRWLSSNSPAAFRIRGLCVPFPDWGRFLACHQHPSKLSDKKVRNNLILKVSQRKTAQNFCAAICNGERTEVKKAKSTVKRYQPHSIRTDSRKAWDLSSKLGPKTPSPLPMIWNLKVIRRRLSFLKCCPFLYESGGEISWWNSILSATWNWNFLRERQKAQGLKDAPNVMAGSLGSQWDACLVYARVDLSVSVDSLKTSHRKRSRSVAEVMFTPNDFCLSLVNLSSISLFMLLVNCAMS